MSREDPIKCPVNLTIRSEDSVRNEDQVKRVGKNQKIRKETGIEYKGFKILQKIRSGLRRLKTTGRDSIRYPEDSTRRSSG